MEDIVYTVAEAAKLLKVNPNCVYSLVNKKILPALKLKSIKIRKSAIINFLEEYEGKDLSDLDNIKELSDDENENLK